RRKPARRPPQTILRWWIYPLQSSRSVQGSAFWSSFHFCLSDSKQPLAAQKGKQRQQRQAEDGEMIALDAVEQMHPEPFELISADAGGYRLAGLVQIGFDFAFAQAAHRHFGNTDIGRQYLAVAGNGKG